MQLHIKLVLQHSYLFQPIISAIIHILSPLAQSKNQSFEDFIEMGFNKFEEILSPTSSESKILQHPLKAKLL
jgi:hypothetical protein